MKTISLTKDAVTIAYLKMAEKAQQPERSLTVALAEAEALCGHLGFGAEAPAEAAGGGAAPAVELTPEQSEGFRVLCGLFKEDGKAVGAAAFAEGMDLDKDQAAKMLEKFVSLGIAEKKGRGRGMFYTPTADAPAAD